MELELAVDRSKPDLLFKLDQLVFGGILPCSGPESAAFVSISIVGIVAFKQGLAAS